MSEPTTDPGGDSSRFDAQRLELARAAASLGIFEYVLATGAILWDARVRELWGLEPNEPIDYPLFLTGLHPEDREATHARVEQVLAPGSDGRFYAEYRVVSRRDGETRWVAATGQIFGEDTDRRLIGIVQDISERKRAEAAERDATRFAARVLDSLFAFAGVMTPDGVLLDVNRAPLEAAGIRAEDVVGRLFWDCYWWSYSPEVQAELREAVGRAARGEWVRYDVPVRVAGDGRLWIDFQIAPMRDETGRITHLIPSAIDISARKRAEEELRRADRRKDEFLATLAHELRNPLATVGMAVELLKLPTTADETGRRACEILERQFRHMARLVDDLLDVGRIAWGKLELRRERVDLAGVLAQAAELARASLYQGGHELVVSLPPRPVEVEGDAARLAQVFANLLNNACKYSEGQGSISLSAALEGEQVVVRVRDQGIGIAPEALPGVFDMFYQVETSRARHPGGLGIGLSLVRRLVELHGGTVSAHSDGPGRGSELRVRLPVAAGAVVALPHRMPIPASQRLTRRVLVVDNDRFSADSLAMLLRRGGSELETAHDGVAAIEAGARFRPDVVLLDLDIPRLNGLDACRRIRGEPWGKDLMIIALTGRGQDELIAEVERAGFDAHLTKPFVASTLLDLLAQGPEGSIATG